MPSDFSRRHARRDGNELPPLPDAVFVLLRDLIVERTGVLFDDSKRSLLADKLAELVAANGLSSFVDYYYLLRYDDAVESHWAALMNRLAVPETFFWRQPEQLQTLANVLAPDFFARRPGDPLRIWSAACCTGEEPLSIAIALAEAGLLGKYPIEIIATDGSDAMIERAKRANYGERSFRQTPDAIKSRYFIPDGTDRWRPIDALSGQIRWGVANLVQPIEIARLATADVIFCRNVFIYFSDDAIRATTDAFAERMPPDGYLFLGASESLTRLDVDFELAEVGGAFVYVKARRRESVERRFSAAKLRASPETPRMEVQSGAR
jgi:chemotaxis protein methyltransferase CheR